MNYSGLPTILCAIVAATMLLLLPLNSAQPDPDMSADNNYRCGIFLMPGGGPPGPMSPPPRKVYALPTKLKATCSQPNPSVYNQTCFELMRLSFNMWNYEQPSKRNAKSGKTIGDDFCTLIGQDEYMGRQVGFFFNYCGRSDWIDTGLRRKTRVCCRGGKYVTCRA